MIETTAPPRRAQLLRVRGGIAGPLGLSLFTSEAIVVLNILTGILLAHSLGVENRGALAAVYLWPLIFATAGSLGISEAVTYHAARGTAPLGTLVGTSVVLALLQSLVLIAIGLVVLPLVLSSYDESARQAALLFLLYIPLNIATLNLMGVLNGLQRFSSFHALRLLLIAVTAAGMVALAATGELTVGSAISVYLGASVVWIAAAALLVGRVEGMRVGASVAVARQLLGFGLRSHPGAVAGMLNEQLDKLVISVALGPELLGLYVIAVTLTALTDFVGTSVGMVALPAVARLEPGPERTRAARRFIAVTVALSAAVTVPMIVLAPRLIEVLFPDEFVRAADVTRVLLVAAILLSTNRALAAVLRAVNRPIDASRGQIIALGATVLALAIFLPWLGLIGAGVASLVAYAVSMISLVRRTARALELRPSKLLLLDRRAFLARFLSYGTEVGREDQRTAG